MINQRFLHKNCIHYKDGFCNLNQISVNPDESACQRFAPKKIVKTSKEEGLPLASMKANQEHLSENGKGYIPGRLMSGLGKRRKRGMHRSRRGRQRKR